MTDLFRELNLLYEIRKGIGMGRSATQPVSILLYGHDTGLVQTRAWVLGKEGFSVLTAFELSDLSKIGLEEPVDLFLLCDSLDEEARSQALTLIHFSWPGAKRLVLAPVGFPAAIEPTEEVFHAIEGPGRLVKTIRTLIVNGSATAC